MLDKEDEEMNMETERRIGTELTQSHSLIKWVLGILITELLVIVLGGVKIYVNDENQDKEIDSIQARMLITPTREEVKLLDKLVLAEVKITKTVNRQTKDSLDSLDKVASALLEMKKEIAEIKK